MQADSMGCDRGRCGNLATCPYDGEHIATVGSTNGAGAKGVSTRQTIGRLAA